MKHLKQTDEELYNLLLKDENYYLSSIDLIAGLSIPTRSTYDSMKFGQLNRASEGYVDQRYIGAGKVIDEIELLAIKRACSLFNFDHANVQVNSGTQANLAIQQAICNINDTILSMNLNHGGHLSHGFQHSLSGKLFNIVNYTLQPETCLIDYDEVRNLAKKYKPKLIIAGSSSYPRFIDYFKFAEIAKEVCAFLLLDISHPVGFIATGIHDIPNDPHVIITFTTEKTLCGPRGGIILCSDLVSKKIDRAVFPCLQSPFAVNIIAGKAAIMHEAKSQEYKKYQKQIIQNAKIMSDIFLENGLSLVTDGTDSHIILIDLTGNKVSGLDVENILLNLNIMSNRQVLPYDKYSARIASGIRLGTTCITAQNISNENIKLLSHT